MKLLSSLALAATFLAVSEVSAQDDNTITITPDTDFQGDISEPLPTPEQT